jgi:stearoyl-CoA desaturase (delta-9 desaturase)
LSHLDTADESTSTSEFSDSQAAVVVAPPPRDERDGGDEDERHDRASAAGVLYDGDDLLPPPAPTSEKIAMGAAVLLPFVGLIAAIVLLWTVGWMGWLYVGMLIGGWMLTGLGITVGFHRLLTHRAFETYPWVRAFWMAMGALAIEGSPLVWCAIHRRHHELSDQHGDPHSPHLHGKGFWRSLKGLIYAQFGWLFAGFWASPKLERYVPDLLKEPLLVKVDKVYYIFVILSLLIPTAIGGLVTLSWHGALLGLIWGGLVRVFVTHHVTWSINSICHVFGRREFKTTDQSTNNLICGILGLGEGWHNTHHAFPTSARHGLSWWQFDMSWIVIKSMQLCGLAWDLKLPNEKAIAARRI